MSAKVVRLPVRGPVPRGGLSAEARAYLQASATFGLFRGAAEMAHWHLPADLQEASIALYVRLFRLSVEWNTAAEALGLIKPEPPAVHEPPRAPRKRRKPKRRPLLFEVPLLAVPEPPDAAG